MAAGPFNSHITGFTSLLKGDDWSTDSHYAVLATSSETPDRATQVDYADIANECADSDYGQVDITGETVSAASGNTGVKFDCAKITFGSDVSITAQYLYILKGDYSSPDDADEIIGHVDLNLDGDTDLESSSAEFSFDPHADGLFVVNQTAAAA